MFIGVLKEKNIMKQMLIREEAVVHVNYESSDLPATVRQFKPVIFKEDEAFCCILGPDRDKGIYGCGRSVKEAIHNWDASFHKRLSNYKEDDEVARFVLDSLSVSKKDVW
jgi:hypothetical protein